MYWLKMIRNKLMDFISYILYGNTISSIRKEIRYGYSKLIKQHKTNYINLEKVKHSYIRYILLEFVRNNEYRITSKRLHRRCKLIFIYEYQEYLVKQILKIKHQNEVVIKNHRIFHALDMRELIIMGIISIADLDKYGWDESNNTFNRHNIRELINLIHSRTLLKSMQD